MYANNCTWTYNNNFMHMVLALLYKWLHTMMMVAVLEIITFCSRMPDMALSVEKCWQKHLSLVTCMEGQLLLSSSKYVSLFQIKCMYVCHNSSFQEKMFQQVYWFAMLYSRTFLSYDNDELMNQFCSNGCWYHDYNYIMLWITFIIDM